MGKVIPLKFKHERHDTEIEFKEDRGRVVVTVDMSNNGRHEIGVAFFMNKEQEEGLFNWLLSRRIIPSGDHRVASGLPATGQIMNSELAANPSNTQERK